MFRIKLNEREFSSENIGVVINCGHFIAIITHPFYGYRNELCDQSVLDIDLDNEAENESEKEKNKEVDEEKNKVRPSSFAFQLKTLRTKHSFLGRSIYFSSPSQDIFLPPPELKLYA